MPTIFSKIVAGEIPSYKVAEDERFYAFLDISPLKKGHTLVIPKQETDYIFDLDADTFADLNRFAQKVAKALKQAVDCERVAVMVLGLEVPHAHIHLIPIDNEKDVLLTNPRLNLSADEFSEIAERIRKRL